MGLHESLQGLFPDLRREFATFMRDAYPGWLANLEGDRPPLSIDIVGEFLMPVLERNARRCSSSSTACGSTSGGARAAARAALRHRDDAPLLVLPTATPYSRNALFSGLFPSEIAARFPDWWGEREDESLNAHERGLLEAQLAELKRQIPVRYEKISTPRTRPSSSAACPARSRARG